MIETQVKRATTRNIRKPGDAGKFDFCTFTESCNGLISWSFEIPASAYCHRCVAFRNENRYCTNCLLFSYIS